MVSSRLPKPEFGQISALTALVLLTYGLIRMIVLPAIDIEFPLFGLLIQIEFKTQSIMLLLAGALTASGADWLVRHHPYYKPGQSTFETSILPALAAIAIGGIIIRVPEGAQLWIAHVIGALVLVLIVWAEFIVSFPRDPRARFVGIALNGLAFLLMTSVLLAIAEIGIRAIFAIPLIGGVSFAVIWRLLRLASPRKRVWPWALLISVAVAQIATGLHYWPISPLRTSLLLAFTLYSSYTLMLHHLAEKRSNTLLFENLFIGGLSIFILANIG
ncbi:MAG: hypothetical protein IIC78_14120 [Chloroflexi bacterium]|nr:hypothetical protein [Chloroflexota bacterium]